MIRKAFTLLMTAALLSVPAAASAKAAPQRVFPVSEKPSLEDHFPIVPVAFPGGVKGYRDIVYQQINGHIPQVVDIYVPASKGPHPLVLYIHGGGWVGGHTRHSGALANFPRVLAALAAEGFVVASLEYRLSGDAKFPAQVQDAKASLRFLSDNAARYRIDPSRVGIWGGSAGGHLTALTALSCKDTGLDPAAASDVCATAAVTWYGVYDFAAMAAGRANGVDGAAEKLLGCTGRCSAETYAPASPVTYVDAKDPPFLLIHGTEDKVVPVEQSRIGEARLRAAGVPVETIYIDGVDHSFIGATPAQTRDATLRATNATFDFFHQKLRVPR
ncbi:alpha/beta hydrolase [Novosphingobium sp.]|uniref:alpha/beta hydrolase n=1 Tax=Novosphingobium sp. TaxID=1874826 RepID=UPI00286E3F24|nr:alpha/beta hydrolase [Novosphingobium sp.]